MRLHITSLPHTQVIRAYDYCAYTAKVRRFADMMTGLGHEVILYAGEECEASVAELVTVATAADRTEWFGHDAWPTDRVFDCWEPADPSWMTMTARAVKEIERRLQPGDVVGIIAGACQHQLLEAFTGRARVVEWGVGYSGVIADFRVYESYAWMHYLAGRRPTDDVRFYDAVVPNGYDPADYLFAASPGEYLLYLGRPTVRKGQQIIAEIAQRTDIPVHTAGQGPAWLPGATHHGVVLGREKAQLLAGARALLAPTTYLEPFGGVVVEALLSGTPVITTDYGAFTETVIHGRNGFRCHTLGEFVDAVHRAHRIDRVAVCSSAAAYHTSMIALRYDEYFRRLSTLDGAGWYA